VAGNDCHFELEVDLLRCLIIILKSWTACYHQIDQFPYVVGPRGCGPCRMEREVVRRLHARSVDRSDSPGASTFARRHAEVTWYRLLGYFLAWRIGEHPMKNR